MRKYFHFIFSSLTKIGLISENNHEIISSKNSNSITTTTSASTSLSHSEQLYSKIREEVRLEVSQQMDEKMESLEAQWQLKFDKLKQELKDNL